MKTVVLFFSLVFFAASSFAADSDSNNLRDSQNLKVLSDSAYRQPLQEVVVRAQAIPPDWQNAESVTPVVVDVPATRLQWFPRYDPDKPVPKTSPNPDDEQPLIQIFKKMF